MKLFVLPEIDREETRKKVESEIEKYRICLLQIPEERLPKVTASYSLQPPSFTNAFHSSTEETAVYNASLNDYELERLAYIDHFRKAVNRLRFREREFIINRYMADDELFDYEYYSKYSLTESKFYRLKARAFYNLAFALRVEIYKKDVVKHD
jgi:ArpU family phage transcriptional regulator